MSKPAISAQAGFTPELHTPGLKKMHKLTPDQLKHIKEQLAITQSQLNEEQKIMMTAPEKGAYIV